MKKNVLIAAMIVLVLCFGGCGSQESTDSIDSAKPKESSVASSETVSNNADDTVISKGAVSSEESREEDESKAKESEVESEPVEKSTAESKVNKIGGDGESSKEEHQESEIEFTEINLGDKITNDFVEMTVENASVAQELYPSDTSGVYTYQADKDGEEYIYLKGGIKNVGGDSYSVEEMSIRFFFDDKYEYSGYVKADDGEGDFFGDYVKPFGTVSYYIVASVPDELINTYSKCKIEFAFHDNFDHDYSSDFSKYENRYTITLSK